MYIDSSTKIGIRTQLMERIHLENFYSLWSHVINANGRPLDVPSQDGGSADQVGCTLHATGLQVIDTDGEGFILYCPSSQWCVTTLPMFRADEFRNPLNDGKVGHLSTGSGNAVCYSVKIHIQYTA